MLLHAKVVLGVLVTLFVLTETPSSMLPPPMAAVCDQHSRTQLVCHLQGAWHRMLPSSL